MSNEALEQYPIPIEVEKQLKDGFYDNLEAELNPKNYRSCLRILLYLEEMERRHRFKRYAIVLDVCCIVLLAMVPLCSPPVDC